MKKFFLTIVALGCLVSMAGALDLGFPVSFDIDPIGYMNHTVFTTYDNSKLATGLGGSLGSTLGAGTLSMGDGKSTLPINAYAIGLDLHVSYFYLAASFGFPFKLKIDGINILASDDVTFQEKAGGSVIFDGQLGGAYDVMTLAPELSKSMSLNVGGGLALNMLYTKQPITQEGLDFYRNHSDPNIRIDNLKNMTDVQKQFSMGLGLNVNFSYYFTKNIGLNVALSDSILFIPIVSERYFKGELKNGQTFTYTLEGGKDIKKSELIKSQFSNNFTARLGLAVKL